MTGDCLNVTVQSVESILNRCESDFKIGVLRGEVHLKALAEGIPHDHEIAIETRRLPAKHAENRCREDAHEHPHLRLRQLDHLNILPLR